MDNVQLDYLKAGVTAGNHHIYINGDTGEITISLDVTGDVFKFKTTDRQREVIDKVNETVEKWNFYRRKGTKVKRIVLPETLNTCTNPSISNSII